MNVKGKVIKVGETQVVSDKFSKRELWIEVPDGQYPQTICVEFINQKTTELDSVSVGDTVDVSINLRGRIHKDKCYNTIQGWKIIKESAGTESKPTKVESIGEPVDDLPF